MATVEIKWGVVGDGIAVSGVKKRGSTLLVSSRRCSSPQDTIACNGEKDEKFSFVLFDRGTDRERRRIFLLLVGTADQLVGAI